MKTFVLNQRRYELRESELPHSPNYWNHREGKLKHFWLIDSERDTKLMGIAATDADAAMLHVSQYSHYLSQGI
jgi:hypothetical protein